jgi:hypothetical protein
MSPLIVSIPHRLGCAEATKRIKSGIAAVRTNYSALVTIHEETWVGDRLTLKLRALGQGISGVIDVADDHVRFEVMLPWLLAAFAERLTPLIQRKATLMLDRK